MDVASETGNMRMLILAGGFGSRLQSVLTKVPKALAPVGDKPFLHLQLENWLAQGARSFVFLLHHQARLIREFLDLESTTLLRGCDVSIVVEPIPFDTGGAIAHAVKTLGLEGELLVANADTWLGAGVHELMHIDAPSIAVIHLEHTGRYGKVSFDGQCRITAFSEKSGIEEQGWINAGMCHLHADMFKSWNGQPFSLERLVFADLASQGVLRAVPLNTEFIDIGVPNDYFRFCRWIEAGRKGSLCN